MRTTVMASLELLRARARCHPPRVWLLWALGCAALLAVPLALADPAFVALVLDPELMALLAAGMFGRLRGVRRRR